VFRARDAFPTRKIWWCTHQRVRRDAPCCAGCALVANAGDKLAYYRPGSIGDRNSWNATLYRASRATLNSVLADTRVRFGPPGAICIASTRAGSGLKWWRGAELEVDVSVRGMRANARRALSTARQIFELTARHYPGEQRTGPMMLTKNTR
jgi:hypothetical protein